MNWLLFTPFFLQGIAILVDEFYFHHRRGLPRWERIGHPLDTSVTLSCYVWIQTHASTDANLNIYILLCIASCLLITKDEWIHTAQCKPAENWLHSILFILHPIAFFVAGFWWMQNQGSSFILIQILLMSAFLLYQIIHWNCFVPDQPINNKIYDDLGDRWYTAQDDPVALLRAESKLKNPWVFDQINFHFALDSKMDLQNIKVLDVGCGAGFLSNSLAQQGLTVTGVDLSLASLEVARRYDQTKSVNYQVADAGRLPYLDQSFDVITAMDFLEHVENPKMIIEELSRVLKPKGVLIYHTFNRNIFSYFIIIKFVEWFVKNTPKQMHVLRLFIKPAEMIQYCEAANLKWVKHIGIRPVIGTISFRDLRSGIVPIGLRFQFTPNLLLSYLGVAKKP
jgi:2-polyprenyl-6-hydroxyphenyl methylase/3-demethylubiquinone-9 3-methyltransferase